MLDREEEKENIFLKCLKTVHVLAQVCTVLKSFSFFLLISTDQWSLKNIYSNYQVTLLCLKEVSVIYGQ